MKRKNAFILCAIGIVVIALLLWGRPVSFWEMTGASRESLHSISASCTEFGITNGKIDNHVYKLETMTADNQRAMEFFDLMAGCSYVPSLRNLLPWPRDTVSGGGDKSSNYSVYVGFTWGDEGEHFVTLSYMGARKICLNLHDEQGLLVYLPTDWDTVDRLGDFLKEYETPS